MSAGTFGVPCTMAENAVINLISSVLYARDIASLQSTIGQTLDLLFPQLSAPYFRIPEISLSAQHYFGVEIKTYCSLVSSLPQILIIAQ